MTHVDSFQRLEHISEDLRLSKYHLRRLTRRLAEEETRIYARYRPRIERLQYDIGMLRSQPCDSVCHEIDIRQGYVHALQRRCDAEVRELYAARLQQLVTLTFHVAELRRRKSILQRMHVMCV